MEPLEAADEGRLEVDEVEEAVDHVVLLVHGIRTHAFWQDTVKEILEEVPGLRAVPIKYGNFPLFRFLVPGPWRKGPSRRIKRELRLARKGFPNADISVICHSFGTYSVCRALEEGIDLELRHLILCGSILREGYSWSNLHDKVKQTTANDVGVKDIWPVFARLASVGFGASGTFGFGTVAAPDRFFDFRHSDFFNEEFVREHWLPIVRKNGPSNVRTPSGHRPPNPKWISALAKPWPTSAFWAGCLLTVAALVWSTISVWAPAVRKGIDTVVPEAESSIPAGDTPDGTGMMGGGEAEPPPSESLIRLSGDVVDVEDRWNELDGLTVHAGPLNRQIAADYRPREYSVELSVNDSEVVHVVADLTGYVQVDDPKPLTGPWSQEEYERQVRLQLRTTRAEQLFAQAKNLLANGRPEDAWNLHLQAWELVPKDRYVEALPGVLSKLEPSDRGRWLLDLRRIAGGEAFQSVAAPIRYKVFFSLGNLAEGFEDLGAEIEPGLSYHDFAVEGFERAMGIDPLQAQPYQAKMQLELRAEHHFDAAATAKRYFGSADRDRESDIEGFLTEWATAVEKGTGFLDATTPAAYVENVRSQPTWLEHWRELDEHLAAYSEFFTGGPSAVDKRLRKARRRASRILREPA